MAFIEEGAQASEKGAAERITSPVCCLHGLHLKNCWEYGKYHLVYAVSRYDSSTTSIRRLSACDDVRCICVCVCVCLLMYFFCCVWVSCANICMFPSTVVHARTAMHACLGGWVNGWTAGWMAGWMHGCMDARMDAWMPWMYNAMVLA